MAYWVFLEMTYLNGDIAISPFYSYHLPLFMGNRTVLNGLLRTGLLSQMVVTRRAEFPYPRRYDPKVLTLILSCCDLSFLFFCFLVLVDYLVGKFGLAQLMRFIRPNAVNAMGEKNGD